MIKDYTNKRPRFYVGETKSVYHTRQSLKDTILVNRSEQIANFLFTTYFDLQFAMKEYSGVIGLNRANKIILHEIISEGGKCGTVVDTRLIFPTLLIHGCTAFILWHNHPSDRLIPSDEDLKITKEVKEAGNFLNIRLLDHIILGENPSYYSFADEGKLIL
jgi:DNA repair protein RadC